MTSGSSHPVPARAAEPPRWFHWGILCVLLGIGGLIRFNSDDLYDYIMSHRQPEASREPASARRRIPAVRGTN